MRLRRLDLTRYGKFTDHSIDFGERVAGEPDLHVLYGPNEAGKSTTMWAYLDLLFGIEAKSGYAFLHPYGTMRIGAALDFGGGAQQFARVKRPQNSLLDHNDQPVPTTAILRDLGGIDREAYRTMFSLDDEKLESGGESILASKGDLGQLLFSASAGLVDFSNGLVDLRAEADRFYKFKARTGELAELKKRLAELKADRELIDTLATDYVRLVQDRDRTAKLYDETVASRSRVQARMDDIQRQVNALPRLAALRGLRERLAPLDDCPEAPIGWVAEVAALQKEAVELAVGSQAIADEIDLATARIAAIVVDKQAPRLARQREVFAPLRARFITADKDLPDRRLRLRDAETAIARLLQRLERDGETAPLRLVLGASVTGRLRELIETRSGIDAALASATKEFAAARGRLDAASVALRDTGGDTGPAEDREAASANLAATVAAIRMEDFVARGRLAERAGEAARLKLGERLRELRPWEGDVDQLIDLRVPHPDTIARWKTTIAEAQKRIERHGGDIERLTTERRRHEAERQAIGAGTGLVTDEDASRIRVVREEAWAVHRRQLDAVSAGSFEAALRRDDAATTGRFGHMAELAALNQASRAVFIAEAEGARAIELKEAATAALRSAEGEVAQSLDALSPRLKGLTPPQLETWLHKRDQALQARELLWTAERDRREAHADAVAAHDRLGSALAAAGCPQNPQAALDKLLAAAQAVVEREAKRQTMLAAVEEHRRDIARRERDLAAARAGEQDWADAWAKICASCWLGEGGEPPALATVREILPILADLGPALETRAGLADRIDKMEQDQAVFQNEMAALAADAGISQTGISALAIARMIDERVEAARAAHILHDSESRKLEGLHDRQRTLAARVAIHERRVAEIADYFGVASLAEAARALVGAEKRAELKRQAGEATRDILDALRLTALDDAEHLLDAVDRAQLDIELGELKTRFDDADQRRLELFLTHSHAIDRVEAIGGDAKVAEIEERRRTVLLEIEEGALRYLRLRAGTVATEWALRAYRDNHRSSMLAEASKAFEMISRGAYSGLAAQPDKDSEILIALPAAGGSKEARDLSKGTRFQLYLALRVAGYHEFARTRRPVPFIADDIMETFDDFRAEEAFRLFAGMANVGQVIYLTHHRHLCEIARATCPGARIHELPSGRA